MTDQTITATPVNAPDILRNQPLSRQVDISLETTILEPVSHQYTSANGGRTTFVLPAKGVLDSPNASIVWELNTTEADYSSCYTSWAGALGMVRRISCRCGGTLLSQVENAGMYATIRSNFTTQDEKEGVLDARHGSQNRFENRIAPAKLTVGADRVEFQQLYNTSLDQTSSYGQTTLTSVVGGGRTTAPNTHEAERPIRFRQTAGTGFEAVVKLSDLFEFFSENKLPLLAMAQVEIEIEWANCGDVNVLANNIVESAVRDAIIPNSALNNPARTNQGLVSMVQPTMILDYIHYDDVERQKIFDAVNSGGGMRLDFSEVVLTRGINPAGSVAPGGANNLYEVVASNHIIGMAQKEVKKIYVVKQYDSVSATGSAEANGDLGEVQVHRNPALQQFKSTQILGERYNWFINNQRVYDRDVENPATAHNYLSQCGGNWYCPQAYFNTTNYNATACKQLLDASFSDGAITQNHNQGRTKRYLAGEQNVIGLSLDKVRAMGSAVGNGTRIGSAPIEFNYSRVAEAKSAGNGGALASALAEVNLDFYICYRRSLIIRALGLDVSDA